MAHPEAATEKKDSFCKIKKLFSHLKNRSKEKNQIRKLYLPLRETLYENDSR